jgi:hypothetical protein
MGEVISTLRSPFDPRVFTKKGTIRWKSVKIKEGYEMKV